MENKNSYCSLKSHMWNETKRKKISAEPISQWMSTLMWLAFKQCCDTLYVQHVSTVCIAMGCHGLLCPRVTHAQLYIQTRLSEHMWCRSDSAQHRRNLKDFFFFHLRAVHSQWPKLVMKKLTEMCHIRNKVRPEITVVVLFTWPTASGQRWLLPSSDQNSDR